MKTKEEPKKAIVPQQKQAMVPTNGDAPAYLTQFGSSSAKPEGFEDVRPEDVKVPRLAIAQALSPQLDESHVSYIAGLKKGDFFNTVTKKVYGSEINVIPLLKYGSRLLFKDMDSGGGILCRSNDMKHGEGDPGGECAKCPMAKFGSARGGEGKGTACSEFYNFPILIVEDGKVDPENAAIWSAKSSHIDTAKHLIGLAMRRRVGDGARAPMWSGVYSLTSKVKKFGEKLSAYVPVADNAGWVGQADVATAQNTYRFMDELRQQNRLTTDDPSVDEPGASDESNA